MISLEEFSKINRQRCESINGFSHKLDSWSLSDWMTALVGEVGEAANIIKKLNRIRDSIPGNTIPDENMLRECLYRELADVFIYLDLLSQALGIDLIQWVVKVFNEKSRQLRCSILIPEKEQQSNTCHETPSPVEFPEHEPDLGGCD